MTSGNMANMNITFGNIRNMTKVKTLFRKCYLLAGVMMAANMFVVNEVKASKEINNNNNDDNNDNNDGEDEKFSITRVLNKTSGFLLNWENTINFIGGLVFSSANNYFKWWNYDQRSYWELGCRGLRSKSLLNGIFQFEANINLGRGTLWLVPGAYIFIRGLLSKDNDCINDIYTAISVANSFQNGVVSMLSFYIVFFLQGFFSAPLTVHISNFSFSISLDSILWMIIGSCAAKYAEELKEERIKKYSERDFEPIGVRQQENTEPIDITEKQKEDEIRNDKKN